MNILPTTREGALLAKLRNMFGSDAQIQEGDIRVEKVLSSSNVSQRFNLNGEGANKRPLEVFIGLNDLVIPYAIKLAVNKVLDTTLPGNNGNCDDMTYADITLFSAAATLTAVSEADCIRALFSGNMSMKANTIEVLNTMQFKRFYRSPQTQQSAGTVPQLEDGYTDVIQPAIFSGRDTNILEYAPAPGTDLQQIAGAAPSQNILVIAMKVMVVRNGAQPATWPEVDQILQEFTSNRVIL